MRNHCFNIVTFNHPKEELTFYFTNKEQENLNKVNNRIVPDEVIEHFGKQEYYYTSFEKEFDGFYPATKPVTPNFETKTNEDAKSKSVRIRNSALSISLLKRYYNAKIHHYFQNQGLLVKPNFINDTEVWLPSQKYDSTRQYNLYDRFSLKVQFQTVTRQLEILLAFEGIPKVFKQSIEQLQEIVSPKAFNWVVYKKGLYKFDELPSAGKREYDRVFPVWNFAIRDALGQETKAPKKSNKYINFKKAIDEFYQNYLDSEEFKEHFPINSNGFIQIEESKIGRVNRNSNKLLFGNNQTDIVPMNGIKDHGPYDFSETSKIHFFFIFHQDDYDVAKKIDNYFQGKEFGFKGLTKFIHIPYHTEPGFSIRFSNRENPWPDIYKGIINKDFKEDIQYLAIYISPFSKNTRDKTSRAIYYKVKELLLKKGVSSQVIDADKVLIAKDYHYSLPNIAIAILAKLKGTPWRLDTTPQNELIVGIGAFKNTEYDVKYIGSAFSFSNNGKFNRFECFQQDQIKELSGSIIIAVEDYVKDNPEMDRLIIHFYKSMSQRELQPIEDGLRRLGLSIPVFIVSINKTQSADIVAFDMNWEELMPLSGTYIKIGFNRFLLCNNTRYSDKSFKKSEGFPFPIKLKIECTQKELVEDINTVKQLIDQVYQFSRMYWKSVSQQNLPVTIKYPEMVAEMLPHFTDQEIPQFGKNNLWFL